MHLHNQTELLRLDDIRVALKEGKRRFTAVNGVSVSICAGRNLGIIGESGCGKTLLCHCILGLLDQDEWETEGSILFKGTGLSRERMAYVRDFAVLQRVL